MRSKDTKLPNWIHLLTYLFALLSFSVTATLIFAPGYALETVDLQARGTNYLISMWAARQFAVGVSFAYSALKRSPAMITMAYLFFLVMNIGDLIIGVKQGDKGLISGALLMDVLSIIILLKLRNTRVRTEENL